MKKKIAALVYVLLTLTISSFSQNDSLIYLKGYDTKSYLQYFDSLHNVKKEALSTLEHSYSCYIIFYIDKDGNISDFEFIEIPEAPLPEIAKNYIKYLFSATNGMWTSNKMEINKGKLSELFFSVTLLKANQAIEERLKDLDKAIAFSLLELKKQKRLIGKDLTKERIMTFSF
ncbi:MAG: hypothetical protein IPP73_20395 [Chitinophagaceae bacterium]|nr:hypothetical protein [Chitinophagaceae bacterium]